MTTARRVQDFGRTRRASDQSKRLTRCRQLGGNFFSGVFLFFERGFSFSGFLFFFFSESAESVAPITFCQLPRSANRTPYLSTTGTSPAANLESHRRPFACAHIDLTPEFSCPAEA